LKISIIQVHPTTKQLTKNTKPVKKWIISLIIISVTIGILLFFFKQESTEKYFEQKYDAQHENKRVETKKEIREILDSFPTIRIKDVDKSYLDWSKSNFGKYKKILRKSEFRVLKREDFFKKIVGDFRINDFVCKDSIYQDCLFKSEKEYYWLIDEKLLFAVLELQNSLKEKGYDPDAFWIRYGHRHPKKNEEAKGAGSSKHIKGQAIDMVIEDINKDGKYTEKDKEIVLEIVDKKVIRDKGGIGRYPGTKTVHIDTRGTKARWDSY